MCVYSSLAAQSAWRDMTGRRRMVRGWSCSGYLRISRREALIFLPRSHSLGLGLSHLQCKAERMRRGGDGREGEEEWESTALTLTLSLSLSRSPSSHRHHRGGLHARITSPGRGDESSKPRRSTRSPPPASTAALCEELEAPEEGGWIARPSSRLTCLGGRRRAT